MQVNAPEEMVTKRPKIGGLRTIAVFKLLKSFVLLCTAAGIFKMVNQDLSELLWRWVDFLRLDSGDRYVASVLIRAEDMNPEKMKVLGWLTLCYAMIFLTEGAGLWLGLRWAEWLTVIVTASFVPVECYEIAKHANAIKIGLLCVNLAIFAYLIWYIRRDRRAGARTA